ncbi:MAG: hypothetical protein IJ150_07485 [Bacteroidales bacterium]|nr:hypothetical protein [Bacteroidales bacterium]
MTKEQVKKDKNNNISLDWRKELLQIIKDKNNDISLDWRNEHLLIWIPFFIADDFISCIPYAGFFDEGQIQSKSGVYDKGIFLTEFEEVLESLDINPETICPKI